MNAGASAAERLKAFWTSALPASVHAGATEAALSAFESRHNIVLPAELRSYLALVDGNMEWIGTEISFWPLAHMEEELSDWPCFDPTQAVRLLPFADWMISIWAYAIRISPTGDAAVFHVLRSTEAKVARPDLEFPRLCANSFAEFVDLYVRNDPRLYA